jgi:hypothetical protein
MFPKLSERKPCAKRKQELPIMPVPKYGKTNPIISNQIFGLLAVFSTK